METEQMRPAEFFFGTQLSKAIGEIVNRAVTWRGGTAEAFLEASQRIAGIGTLIYTMFPGDYGTNIVISKHVCSLKALSENEKEREEFIKDYKEKIGQC